jgi:hypothetical protein
LDKCKTILQFINLSFKQNKGEQKMKTAIKGTLALAVLMSMSVASAAPSTRETRAVREAEGKSSGARTENVNNAKVLEVIKGLIKRGVSEADIRSALMTGMEPRIVKIKDGDVSKDVNLLELAKETVEKIDAEMKKASKEKQEILTEAKEDVADFLALSSLRDGVAIGDKAIEVQALDKQLSIMSDLASMEVSDLKAHVKMMKLAVKIKADNPNMSGNSAFVQGLREVYKDRANAKIEELINCQKG